MFCCVGEYMVQLMRQYAAYGAPIGQLSLVPVHRSDVGRYKPADLIAIHVAERQNGAVAHMSPPEGSCFSGGHRVAVHLARAFERDHYQLNGHLITPRPAQIAP